jgi:hypothetical protein
MTNPAATMMIAFIAHLQVRNVLIEPLLSENLPESLQSPKGHCQGE